LVALHGSINRLTLAWYSLAGILFENGLLQAPVHAMDPAHSVMAMDHRPFLPERIKDQGAPVPALMLDVLRVEDAELDKVLARDG
jgi:hypothetical protein